MATATKQKNQSISDLRNNLENNSTFEKVSKCEILNVKPIPTRIPALNLILTGDPTNGGATPGITQFVGDSATFKTSYCLECAASFINFHRNKGDDALVLFYSNEHGATPDYFANFGLDDDDVFYKSFDGLEDLTTGFLNDIEPIKLKDNVLIIIDSLGMAASKKEAEDMMSGSDKADMTRAKKINAFARIVTPRLKSRGIPCFIINHHYDTQEMYSKKVVGGGKKMYLASDSILFTSVKNLKEGESVVGLQFDITAMKSRFVKKNLKVSVDIHEETGINRYSGLLDLALQSGFASRPSKDFLKENGYDGRKKWIVIEDAVCLPDEISDECFENLLKNSDFQKWCMTNYSLGGDGHDGIYSNDSTLSDIDINEFETDD